MDVTVCCISDLHGRLPIIPDCDILIIAGDIAPDAENHWRLTPDAREQVQRKWLSTHFSAWEMTVPAAHILATPGNHDWWQSMPNSCKTKVFIDEGIELLGKRFWFSPHVPRMSGGWKWEQRREVRRDIFERIPDRLDMLVTHTPSHGVLDRTWQNDLAGCEELRQAIFKKSPRVHVFGHIHEGRRDGIHTRIGNTDAYNVAWWDETWNPILVTI